MAKDMGTFLIEFYSADNTRSAGVYTNYQYYKVVFRKDGQVIGSRTLFNKTRAYAEDCAENWTLGVINENQIDQLHETVA